MNTIPEWMQIAENGWTVTNFPVTLEFRHKDGRKACVPKPYNSVTVEWWQEQIHTAIKQAKP